MFGDNNPSQSEFDNAMQNLRSAGVATVTVEFSGGNDEGGADGIDYFDAEGNALIVAGSHAYNESGSRYDPDTGKFVQSPARWVVYETGTKRDATPAEIELAQVATVLEHPIYDRWGSFAGEFYVHGTLTWDVAAGTYKLSGQETVETYEDFEDEGGGSNL